MWTPDWIFDDIKETPLEILDNFKGIVVLCLFLKSPYLSETHAKYLQATQYNVWD